MAFRQQGPERQRLKASPALPDESNETIFEDLRLKSTSHATFLSTQRRIENWLDTTSEKYDQSEKLYLWVCELATNIPLIFS